MRTSAELLVARGARRAGWPLRALLLGFPLWWVLGLVGFIWQIMAVPMLISLLRKREVRAPRHFGLWMMFLGWMIASGTQIAASNRWLGFSWRASMYASITIVFLYIYNATKEELPSRSVVNMMVGFWIFVVAGGILGVLQPYGSFASVTSHVMPQRFLGNPFFYNMVHPQFSQVQKILGYLEARPKAPLLYANEWGAAFGLLLPFVVLALAQGRSKWVTRGLIATALVAIVPVVRGLNRGLWLSVGIALLYVTVRFAWRGRTKVLVRAVAVLIVVGAVILVTPLQQLIADRLANPHSNEGRLSLYQEATERTLDSPILGYGAPGVSERRKNAPLVGTQGQLWSVVFNQGIPGTLFFLGWFVIAFWRTRRLDVTGFWCHVALLIALIQLPYYDGFPSPLYLIMIVAGLGMREARWAQSAQRVPRAMTLRPLRLGAPASF